MKFYDANAEKAILSYVLHEGTKAFCKYKAKLSVSDFYYEVCAALWDSCNEFVIEHQTESEFDTVSLYNLMKQKSEDYVSSLKDIAELKESKIIGTAADEYASLIKENSRKRQLQTTLSSMQNMVEESNDTSEQLKAKLCQMLVSTNNDSNVLNCEDALEVAIRFIKSLRDHDDEKSLIFPTGINRLDVLLEGGIRNDTLNIIGARPGIGKSALGSNILINLLKTMPTLKPCVIFSLEMNNEQVIQRILSSFCGLSGTEMTQNSRMLGSHWHEIIAHSTECFSHKDDNAPRLLMCDKSNLSLSDMSSMLSDINQRYGGVGAVMLDYLQLMPTDVRIPKAIALGEISRGLKEIARAFHAPVFALCQLNREVENSKGGAPKASNIKDSGSIEQDADLIILITREKSEATLHVVKNRNGATGSVECNFNENACLFSNEKQYDYEYL